MKTNTTVTVGIPAFNEEANIGFLIKEVLAQKANNFVLKNVVVSSDGSTDSTIAQIKKIKSKKIILLNNRKRAGKALRQSQIMEKINSDILVLLDADILLRDKKFIEKIINPIINNRADLTSVGVEEIKPITFIGKILAISMKFKKHIFENYKNGNNLYTCHGRARAFSKNLYKKIDFKNSVAEDAYSYMYAVSNGYKYRFARGTQVYYKLPENFSDHEKQSLRFYKSIIDLEKKFGSEKFRKENFLTTSILLSELGRYLFINPLIIVYFLIAIFLKLKSKITKRITSTWSISTSSKILRS